MHNFEKKLKKIKNICFKRLTSPCKFDIIVRLYKYAVYRVETGSY